MPLNGQSSKIKPIWVKYWSGDNTVEWEVNGITVDEENSYVYLSGVILGEGQYIFLLKYNADNGDLIWSRIWDESEVCHIFSIYYYEDHIYLAGYCEGGPILLKYHSNGELINKIDPNVLGGESSMVFGVVGYNNLIYLSGEKDIEEVSDMALWCFDLDFNKLWLKTCDVAGGHDRYGIMVEHNDCLYITGTAQISGNNKDIPLLKYEIKNPDGELEFIDSWGKNDDHYNYARGITAHNNHIFITGIKDKSDSYNDIIILNYDLEEGCWEWHRIWSELDTNFGFDITIADNHVFVVGQIISNSYKTYTVVLKYDLDGNLVWSKTWRPDNLPSSCAFAQTILSYNDCLYVGGASASQLSGTNAFLLKCNYNGRRTSQSSQQQSIPQQSQQSSTQQLPFLGLPTNT